MRIIIVLLMIVLCGCKHQVRKEIQTPTFETTTPNPMFLKGKKQLKVAIIDTGLDLKDPRFKDVLCKEGHKDFTGEGIRDINGHGTHIAGLIKQYAGKTNYCLVIFKFFTEQQTGLENLKAEIKALKQAKIQNIDIVNLSEGGNTPFEKEYKIIKSLNKSLVVTAVGNEENNIDDPNYSYYPASYNLLNIIKVGNINKHGRLHNTSSYSRTMVVEIGVNVLSTLPDNRMGYMSGTSQATAIHTGKLIYKILTHSEK